MQVLNLATEKDIPELVRMSYLFHIEGPYKEEEYYPEEVSNLLHTLIQSPVSTVIVSLVDDKTVGFIAGTVMKNFTNTEKTAAELAWWVDHDYRGTQAGVRLREAFEFWAKRIQGAKFSSMGILSGMNEKVLDRYYRRNGYTKAETVYKKEL